MWEWNKTTYYAHPFDDDGETLGDVLERVIKERKENTMVDTTAPKKFWMIVGDGNSPKVRHTDRNLAVTEASRLARANPGTQFYVLETVEMLSIPAGVVRHRF